MQHVNWQSEDMSVDMPGECFGEWGGRLFARDCSAYIYS